MTDDCFLYLVRHGATDNNLADPPVLQGRGADLELSAIGQQQAARTAQFLKQVPLQAAYSSPLVRARQTAEHIAAEHNLSVGQIEDITEVDVGNWEHRDWGEIQREEPEAYRQFIADPASFGYPGGESLQDVQDRVVPALEQLLDSQPGKHVLVVGHNVVNRVFLSPLLRLPTSKAREITQNNCGINVIRRRQGTSKLITVNAVFHLAGVES